MLVQKNPDGLTGGEEGLGLDFDPLPDFFVGVLNTKNLYWLALGYAAVVFVVVRWAVDSSPGHVWQAIRENERRVEVLGLRPFRFKLIAFVLASFLATAAGSSTCCCSDGATPEVTTANFTLTLLVMVVIGGAGHALGRCSAASSTRSSTSGSARSPAPSACRTCPTCSGRRSPSRSSSSARSSSCSSSSCPAGSRASARPRARCSGAAAGLERVRPVDGMRVVRDRVGACMARARRCCSIQGLGYARWGWEPVARAARAHFDVVLFDNRGIGESDVPPGPYTAAELAEDALAVLDEAGVERAHVVGTSLGGMVAQELALARPERVDRLVLACTTPGGARAYPMPERTVRLIAEAPRCRPRSRCAGSSRTRSRPAHRTELVERISRTA